MKYADIPQAILDTVLGESWPDGAYSLQDELNQLGEDIVSTNFMQLPGTGKIRDLLGLTVYTEKQVGVICEGMFGEFHLLIVKRNP